MSMSGTLYLLLDMKKALVFAGVVLSFRIVASSPIESVVLNTDNAKKLGFELEVSYEKTGKYVSLKGPSEQNKGCVPAKAGSFIINAHERDISGTVVDVRGVEKPIAFGYVDAESQNNVIEFIDYICPGSRVGESRRYEVSMAHK